MEYSSVGKHANRDVFVVQAFSVLESVLLVSKRYKNQEMKKLEPGHREIEVLVHSWFPQGLEF